MQKLRFLIMFFMISMLGASLFAQQDSTAKKKLSDILQVRGYVKYMNTASFVDLDNVVSQNLIHNRINLRGYFGDHWRVGLEVRNRVFYGESVRLTPGFGDLLEIDPGLVDMNWTLVNGDAFVVHSTFDRAWVNYINGNFEGRIGRQRINWGINAVWNPNDLFNAFNYVDFDYEERPGSDALRLQYFTGSMSGLEVAYAPGRNFELDNSVGALLFRTNRWNYDFQFLGGIYRRDLALGTGWAGSIGNVGFKGEATYFHPRENLTDTSGVFTTTLSGDYSFKNGMYVMGSVLYNSRGFTEPVPLLGGGQAVFGDISAKNLMPSKYSLFAMVSGTPNPLLNLGFSTIYAPGMNFVLLMPTAGYSMSTNWEIMVVGQTFLGEQPILGFDHLGSGVFVRVKWSY